MEKQLSYLNQLDIQRIQEENDSMTVKRKNLFTAFYDVIGKQRASDSGSVIKTSTALS